jgi:hypothetical protein
MLETIPAKIATSPFKKIAVLKVAPIKAGANPNLQGKELVLVFVPEQFFLIHCVLSSKVT